MAEYMDTILSCFIIFLFGCLIVYLNNKGYLGSSGEKPSEREDSVQESLSPSRETLVWTDKVSFRIMTAWLNAFKTWGVVSPLFILNLLSLQSSVGTAGNIYAHTDSSRKIEFYLSIILYIYLYIHPDDEFEKGG